MCVNLADVNRLKVNRLRRDLIMVGLMDRERDGLAYWRLPKHD